MTEQELSEILSDGRRAYTSFTSADIKQELEAYHDWVEQRATEAQQALDQDLDYQMRLEKKIIDKRKQMNKLIST